MSMEKITSNGKAPQSNNNKLQGKATTNGETGSQKKVYVDTFTINVFFDGTKNNLYNIEHRKKKSSNVSG